ncbi:MAG: hypothetical protein RJQ09_17695 [Cyclobacteriaceae bacterium]
MKYWIFGLMLSVTFGCTPDSVQNEITGNQVQYALFSGSDFGYEGLVIIEELTNGSPRITIELSGPNGEASFPAHLHFGSFSNPNADLAALLTPINAKNGIGITDLEFLSDENKISYTDFINFDGHIKVHLDDGANQDVVLAYGNVGSNKAMLDGEVADCKGPN